MKGRPASCACSVQRSAFASIDREQGGTSAGSRSNPVGSRSDRPASRVRFCPTPSRACRDFPDTTDRGMQIVSCHSARSTERRVLDPTSGREQMVANGRDTTLPDKGRVQARTGCPSPRQASRPTRFACWCPFPHAKTVAVALVRIVKERLTLAVEHESTETSMWPTEILWTASVGTDVARSPCAA